MTRNLKCYLCDGIVLRPDQDIFRGFLEHSDDLDWYTDFLNLIHCRGPPENFDDDGHVVVCLQCLGRAHVAFSKVMVKLRLEIWELFEKYFDQLEHYPTIRDLEGFIYEDRYRDQEFRSIDMWETILLALGDGTLMYDNKHRIFLLLTPMPDDREYIPLGKDPVPDLQEEDWRDEVY